MDFEKFKINFSFAANIFMLVAVLFGGFVWADSNGIWHRAQDVRGGTFGSDELDVTGGYRFIHPVSVDEDLTVNGILKTGVIASNESNGNVIIQLG